MSSGTVDIDGIRHGDRAVVLKPVMKSELAVRDANAMLEEAVGLALAIDLEVVGSAIIPLSRTVPATLLGKGQVEHQAELIAEHDVGLVIIDHTLTPVQQRNLEKNLKCKVIDRTGLILEIFGERARTKEGQLQVELAALNYQKSRLVRSWTHLERQRGGFGFMGGPGESQLEIDRRLIDQRIMRLKADLEQVRRTRGLQRESRQRAEHPVIALVGYTNAGKSSLFNRLTGAGVLAKNMLFATLDPTMRGIKLPSSREAVVSDTVGFISNLPTHLVEAFRATLEEVMQADIILHVRDVAHPEARSQKQSVMDILADLGIAADDKRIIEVLNKIDLLPEGASKNLKSYASRISWESEHMPAALDGVREEAAGGTIGVSALSGEGIDDLVVLLDERLAACSQTYDIAVPISDGAAQAWLYGHGHVVARRDTKTQIHLTIVLSEADHGRFHSRFGKKTKNKS